MSITARILGALIAKRGFEGCTPLFYSMLSNIVAVLALTIILAIMAGALLLGALFIIYYNLIIYGLPPTNSIIITTCILAIVMAILLKKLSYHKVCIKNSISKIITIQTPIALKAGGVCQSFIDGVFKTPQEKTPK